MKMRTIYILLVILSFQGAYAQKKKVSIDRDEAKQAYDYINDFRKDSKRLIKELDVRFDLSKVSKVQLKWNDKLAKAAEFRAKDMASRDYFDHTTPEGIGPNYYINKAGYALNSDWLKNIKANNFESIAANHPTAVDGIKAFIIGKSSPGFMHRKHILGMDDWYGSLYDIGIGFAKVPEGSIYKTYLCVLIAKHDWEKKE